VITAGQAVAWNGTAIVAGSGEDAVVVGAAMDAAGSDAETVRVRLNGVTLISHDQASAAQALPRRKR